MKCTVVVDLQFGSTGKGLICGYLAKRNQPDAVVTAWGPNAGHTWIERLDSGVEWKFVTRQIGVGVISPNISQVFIGPGSVLDVKQLEREISQLRDERGIPIATDDLPLRIHQNAAVLRPEFQPHLEHQYLNRIGSTQKGTGEAMIAKIRREHEDATAGGWLKNHWLGKFVCSPATYIQHLERVKVMQAEGAQGFSLSIHHGFWPWVTSRDCTTAQVVADCGIPMDAVTDVIGTLRTFPIRVANRYDEDGRQVGYSGPAYADQDELDWEKDLGIKPELTTVTQLPRRVFTFSTEQIRQAMFVCRPRALFVNFMNYLNPESQSRLQHHLEYLCRLYGVVEGARYLGYGPTEDDITDRFADRK